ncbi:uncharacterized protein F5147DRAFT_757315 [Suillus discolor]|uniref:Uncharacterized protein n=1 Tax=Suillus discolor TaxID=1912936 RepID=A0A9P7K000_9AGAM|nr:uncharacterized protein F5147DRAFT_757315 [Suillus discolor]KAG2118897.1 hypothetical protein F5147DRAFT_757315 [Suillus discolor]
MPSFLSTAYRTVVFTIERNRKKILFYVVQFLRLVLFGSLLAADPPADEALDILAFFVFSCSMPFAWVAKMTQFNWGMMLNVTIARYNAGQEGRREGWGQARLGEGICPALSVFDATFFACILCHRTVPPSVSGIFGPLIIMIHKTAGRHTWQVVMAQRWSALFCAGLDIDYYIKLASLAGWTYIQQVRFLARAMFDVYLFYPTSNGNCTTSSPAIEEVYRVHYSSTIHEASDQSSAFLVHFSPS